MKKLVVIFMVLSYTTDLLNLTLLATCVGVMLVSINLLCLTEVYQLLLMCLAYSNNGR